jgi:hypothetical protein
VGVWDRIPVTGEWRDAAGDLRTGEWMAFIFSRATESIDETILPAGVIGTGFFNTTEPGPSMLIGVPATDDPVVGISDFEIEIQAWPHNAPVEIYRLLTPMSTLPAGINLADVIPYVGNQVPPAPAPILIKNIPGGIAGLDSTGRVPLVNMPIYVDPVSIAGLPDGTLIARTS